MKCSRYGTKNALDVTCILYPILVTLSIFYYLKYIIDKYIFKYTYLSKYVHDTAYIYIHDIHDISKNIELKSLKIRIIYKI